MHTDECARWPCRPVIRATNLKVQIEASRFNSGQLEQFAHELGKSVHLNVHAAQEVGPTLGILEPTRFEALNKRFQRRNWRPQLVGDVRDEVAADDLSMSQLRNVLEQHENAPIDRQLSRNDLQARSTIVRPAQLDWMPHRTAARRKDDVENVRVAHRNREWPTMRLAQSEQTPRGRIRQRDPVVRVDEEDAVPHVVEKRRHLRAIALQVGGTADELRERAMDRHSNRDDFGHAAVQERRDSLRLRSATTSASRSTGPRTRRIATDATAADAMEAVSTARPPNIAAAGSRGASHANSMSKPPSPTAKLLAATSADARPAVTDL